MAAWKKSVTLRKRNIYCRTSVRIVKIMIFRIWSWRATTRSNILVISEFRKVAIFCKQRNSSNQRVIKKSVYCYKGPTSPAGWSRRNATENNKTTRSGLCGHFPFAEYSGGAVIRRYLEISESSRRRPQLYISGGSPWKKREAGKFSEPLCERILPSFAPVNSTNGEPPLQCFRQSGFDFSRLTNTAEYCGCFQRWATKCTAKEISVLYDISDCIQNVLGFSRLFLSARPIWSRCFLNTK